MRNAAPGGPKNSNSVVLGLTTDDFEFAAPRDFEGEPFSAAGVTAALAVLLFEGDGVRAEAVFVGLAALRRLGVPVGVAAAALRGVAGAGESPEACPRV